MESEREYNLKNAIFWEIGYSIGPYGMALIYKQIKNRDSVIRDIASVLIRVSEGGTVHLTGCGNSFLENATILFDLIKERIGDEM